MKRVGSILDRDALDYSVFIDQKKSFLSFLRKMDLHENAHALSVSTGNGFWDYLVFKEDKRISRITATDIVEEPIMAEDLELIKGLGNWTFTKVEAEKPLPFESNTFDVVYHQDVIEHVKKPYLFLSEQYRVLKEGGYILFGTPNILRPANLLKVIIGKLQFPRKLCELERFGDYVHVQEYTPWSLQIMAQEIGFSEIQTDYCFLGAPSLPSIKFLEPYLAKNLAHYLNICAKK